MPSTNKHSAILSKNEINHGRSNVKTAIPPVVIAAVFGFSGCTGSNPPGPDTEKNASPKDTMQTVSPSRHREGYLQRSYDRWEKEEWEPATSTTGSTATRDDRPTAGETVDNETTAKNASGEKHQGKGVTLQRYVDKWGRYLEKKEKASTGPSHVEKLETMPVIGTPR